MDYVDVLGPVLARVEGCPIELATEAMRNSCMDFCVRTRWLTTGITLTLDGTQVPTFALDQQVVDILEAKIGDDAVYVTYLNDPRVDEIEDGEDPDYDYALRFTDASNAVLTPEPTVADPVNLEMLIVIAPGPTSTGLHEGLWRRWSEGLKFGALWRLYEEPGKPWANEKAALYCKGMYEQAIATAQAEASVNHTKPARRLRVIPA
jgi:hypothetical protein